MGQLSQDLHKLSIKYCHFYNNYFLHFHFLVGLLVNYIYSILNNNSLYFHRILGLATILKPLLNHFHCVWSLSLKFYPFCYWYAMVYRNQCHFGAFWFLEKIVRFRHFTPRFLNHYFLFCWCIIVCLGVNPNYF